MPPGDDACADSQRATLTAVCALLFSPCKFPEPYLTEPPRSLQILEAGFCYGKTICYDTLHLLLRGAYVPLWLLGEHMEIDAERLKDDAYRYAVLNVLVRDYQAGIVGYCVTRLGEGIGEEVAQEVFITAWETLSKFRQDAAITTWLFGIAKNKCAQAFRNRSRRQAMAQAFLVDIRRQAHAEEPETPEHVMVERAQLARFATGFAALRDEERIMLNLRYTKGLSVAEIVEIVGKSEAAVRKQLLRALQRLRKLMDEGSEA
jgi:RNA polymerase sigma factor (sigma-70 family)